MTPSQLVIREALTRIRARGGDGVWLALAEESALMLEAADVDGRSGELPLRGLTVAVKDNVDVAGLPTTAACPAFSYIPKEDATVVAHLRKAGALVLGKTNLDQFATGLNGTRTPHPIPRNVFRADCVSGGSSSGSAVAVAAGLADCALGTDTAGSGRIPAAFNGLCALKPTRGRWSATGVVPACRSLDCVTVFSRTMAGALAVDAIAAGFDPSDPFSRWPVDVTRPSSKRIGILAEDRREFFGDVAYARMYEASLDRMAALGWELVSFDDRPFLDAAGLLYGGPWLAERAAAVGTFVEEHPEAVHPVVREIIAGGARFSATDAFLASYRLADLARVSGGLWAELEAIMLPTAPTLPTIEAMLADPIGLNSKLGRYTNFVNLLDLCAASSPAGICADGRPFGVTFIAPAWNDARVAAVATDFVGEPPPPPQGVLVAVVGAHLRGMPLNHQLLDLGAQFVREARTDASYRLYALPRSVPPKPGLIRRSPGAPIELEIWCMSAAAFGRFVSAIPSPLGIGILSLEDGSTVQGFLCESAALDGASDITGHGGWRAYVQSVGH
jgi:allophanate hydrolase